MPPKIITVGVPPPPAECFPTESVAQGPRSQASERKIRSRRKTEELSATLRELVDRVMSIRGAALGYGGSGAGGAGGASRTCRTRRTADVTALVRDTILVIKDANKQEAEWETGGHVAQTSSTVIPMLPPNMAAGSARLAILKSSTLATILVRTADFVVVESSKALDEYMPWEGMRGYAGQSLFQLTCWNDLGALRDLKNAILARQSVIGTWVVLRMKRVGKDKNSPNLVSAFFRQTITIGHVAEDQLSFLLMFEPAPKDLLPLSTDAAFWEKVGKTKTSCSVPAGTEEVELGCADRPNFFNDAMDNWFKSLLSLQTIISPRIICLWNVAADKTAYMTAFLHADMGNTVGTVLEQFHRFTFQEGNGFTARMGEQTQPMVHAMCLPDDDFPECIFGFEIMVLDFSTGQVVQAGNHRIRIDQDGIELLIVSNSTGFGQCPNIKLMVLNASPQAQIPGSKEHEMIKSAADTASTYSQESFLTNVHSTVVDIESGPSLAATDGLAGDIDFSMFAVAPNASAIFRRGDFRDGGPN